jgi:hypothetical protein
MTGESQLLKVMSADEITILNSHWIIDTNSLRDEMKIAIV